MKLNRYLISLLFFLVLCPAWALAQKSGSGKGNSGNPGTGTPGKSVSLPPSTRPPGTQPPSQQEPELQRPHIIVMGSAMLEDGSAPPQGAVIEMDCGNRVTRPATVNLNGTFSFDIAEPRERSGSVIPDASMGTPDDVYDSIGLDQPRRRQLSPNYQRFMECELRAQLAGYRSTAVRLNTSSLSLVNQAGPIIMYPSEKVRGTSVSATTLLAPKEAKKSLEKAMKAFREEKFAESETLTKSAIQLYPKYAEAWTHLGLLFRKQQRDGEARDALSRAISLDEKYVSPYVQLGWLESREQKWQEAADVTERALALDPITFPDAYFLNTVANFNLRNLDLAEKRGRQQLRLDSSHLYPRVYLILASIAAGRNDYEASNAEMRNYLKYAPAAPDAQSIRERLQEQERIAKSGL